MVPGRVLLTITGAILVTVLVVSPAVGLSRKPSEPDHVPNKVLVKFRNGVTPEKMVQIVESEGGTVTDVLASTGVHLVVLPERMDVTDAIKRFSSHPEILYAEPVQRVTPLEEK